MVASCEYSKEDSISFGANEEVIRAVQCQCYSLMKNELQVFVNELKSMVEINKILKEELKYDNAMKQEGSTSACEGRIKISAPQCNNCYQLDNQLKVTLNELHEEIKILKQTSYTNLNPGNTWTTAKTSTSHNPTTDRQTKEVHGISTHQTPTTANHFEILSDLSED
jgi:uncharacterized protein YerC